MNLILEITAFIMSLPIRAQIGELIGDKLSDVVDNPTSGSGTDAIADFVGNILDVAIPVSVFACVVLLSYAGYIMITSQGNPEKLNEAKEVITNALTGFAVILLSVVILVLINNALVLGIT